MNTYNYRRIQELIDNSYFFDINKYASEGFDLVKREVGLFIGFTIVYLIAAGVLSNIPLIGYAISILVVPPLVAGFHLGADKVAQQQYLAFEDFFQGFDYFAQLVLQQLIVYGFIILLMIPFGFSTFLFMDGFAGNSPGFVSMVFMLLVFGVILIAGIYIGVSYIFAPLFIVFGHQMQAWDAMEASRKVVGKNFFQVFGLLLLIILLNIGGALFFLIGLLFTIPASFAIIYSAFSDIMALDTYNEEGEDGSGDILDHLVD